MQSDDIKDESIQRFAVPEYFFEEDAEEDVIKRLQSAQSEPVDDIILSVPTLMTLSAGNTEFARPEQLAKKIAPGLELLTDKGSPAPWHTPFEASSMPYYPVLVTNNNLLDKVKGTIASQRLSHLEETFHPSSPVGSSPHRINTISKQYIGSVLMPVPGRFLPAERTLTQTVSPLVPFSDEGMDSNFEPSGAFPAALSSEPESEANIAYLSHLPESPSMTSNNIPAGKALAASRSYLFEPPQVASDAVLAGENDVTPVSLPEQAPLFGSEETPDIASVAYRYFERLAPQPPLDKTWGSRQTSPLHWSAGHILPSLTGRAISREMGGPVKAIASTINNSSSGGYSGSGEVGLALAPIGRHQENIQAATSSAANGGQERASEAVGETVPALDLEALASEVYSILKRRLFVERERATAVV